MSKIATRSQEGRKLLTVKGSLLQNDALNAVRTLERDEPPNTLILSLKNQIRAYEQVLMKNLL